jgi:ribosomal-protein-alanine N-acetyltransferase
MPPKPDLTLRYMTLADLPQVMNIDRLSFDVPWAERSYQYEIVESPSSYMVALELRRIQPAPRWQQWLNLAPRFERRVVGYGGLWNIETEAHISTIAVHPRARGRGWGEILLIGMICRSIALRAAEIRLEVRVSNQRARNLYHKYGFAVVDVQRGYYRNNHEDAYIMRLNLLNKRARAQIRQLHAQLLANHPYTDLYTAVEPPARVQKLYRL